jgi:hypothetical protein
VDKLYKIRRRAVAFEMLRGVIEVLADGVVVSCNVSRFIERGLINEQGDHMSLLGDVAIRLSVVLVGIDSRLCVLSWKKLLAQLVDGEGAPYRAYVDAVRVSR